MSSRVIYKVINFYSKNLNKRKTLGPKKCVVVLKLPLIQKKNKEKSKTIDQNNFSCSKSKVNKSIGLFVIILYCKNEGKIRIFKKKNSSYVHKISF